MVLADRIVVLEEGQIQSIGPPRVIYEELASRASDYVSAGVGHDQLLACGSRRVLPTEWKILALESPTTGIVTFDASFSIQTMHGGESPVAQPVSCVHPGFSVTGCRWAGGFWELAVSNPNPMVFHVADSPWLPSALKRFLREWEEGIETSIALWVSHPN